MRLNCAIRAGWLALAVVLSGAFVPAAQATLSAQADPPEHVVMRLPDLPGIYPENPPDFTKTTPDWWGYYVSADSAYRCDSRDNIATASVIDCESSPWVGRVLAGEYWFAPPTGLGPDAAHRHSYYGTFASLLFDDGTATPTIVSVTHGENKNLVGGVPARHHQNTIVPSVQGGPGGCNSGFLPDGGPYEDCYAAYSGFVGTARTSVVASNGWGRTFMDDNGPIVWPRYGYRDASGKRLSHGVRHPAGIAAGGYLYVFYFDTGRGGFTATTSSNEGAGFRVARAPAAALGDPQAFRTYEGRGRWRPSLPAGVSAQQMSDAALASGSPARSDPIFPSNSYTFNVAKIRGEQRWIGVERWYSDVPCRNHYGRSDTVLHTALRYSSNLTDWGPRVDVPELQYCGYEDDLLRYPRFLSTDGASTREVDGDSFMLLGTGDPVGAGAGIRRAHVRVAES